MPDPIDLDPPSADRLYIHTAVAQTRDRLGWSEGHAITMLLSAFHNGLITTWTSQWSVSGDHERCSPASWHGADVDLDQFRAQGWRGIQYSGVPCNLTGFLISRDDFSFWLDNQGRKPSEPVTTTRGKGGRPRRHDRDEFHWEVIRIAQTPDGLPDVQEELTRTMRDWCAKWPDPPDDRTVRDWVSAIYAYLRGNRS